jgi:endonuclease/exonuclease/phosphatase family metal-dependent hydrolase
MLKKSNKPALLILILVLLLLLLIGFIYIKNPAVIDIVTEATATSSAKVTTSDNKITVGTFNLNVLTTKKAGKPEIMGVLSKIVRNFDIIALQEIQDQSQTALPMLKDAVNSIGSSQYEYVVGRTTNIEQFAYFYNTQTIQLMGNPYVYPNSNGIFQKEPYVAQFKEKINNFDFVLITTHTNPDRAKSEIKNLPMVVEDARSRYQGEDEFIVLGDLNADCTHFKVNSSSPLRSSDYFWLINNSVDTTTKSNDCAYDRIIMTNPDMSDYMGNSGVFRFDKLYNLSYKRTIAVSDHYPVYAELWGNRDID